MKKKRNKIHSSTLILKKEGTKIHIFLKGKLYALIYIKNVEIYAKKKRSGVFLKMMSWEDSPYIHLMSIPFTYIQLIIIALKFTIAYNNSTIIFALKYHCMPQLYHNIATWSLFVCYFFIRRSKGNEYLASGKPLVKYK